MQAVCSHRELPPGHLSGIQKLVLGLKKRLKKEQDDNLQEQKKKQGTIVAYGEAVQVM